MTLKDYKLMNFNKMTKVKKIIAKMILLSFILSFGVVAQAAVTNVYEAPATAGELALIRDNLESHAVSYRKSGDLPRKSVSEYLSLLNSDGSFSDKSSTIDVMTGRLLFMAQAYKNDPAWKGNVHLKTNLYSAVQFWLDHDPGNSGWTAGCFNEPFSMAAIGLCLYDAIQNDKTDSPELNSLMDGMIEWANACWTVSTNGELFVGANISYRLMGMIGRAAIANSPEMFDDITNIIASTFTVNKTYGYGRLADESWQQHNIGGGQNYWLGYGADWLHITRRSCENLKNTRWALTDDQLNIFADCIIDGWQWLVYRNQGIYSLLGRHNLKKKTGYDFDFLSGQIDSLRELAGAENLVRNDELEMLKNRLANLSMAAPSFNDSKYFYKSDLMICGKPFHYVAAKMLSKRTAGPESGNGEGKKNYHFGEGSTMIFKTGKEYLDARVGWNFRAIPGTTVEQKTDTLPLVNWGINANSYNTFAGGVSDGDNSVCAFQLHRVYKYSTVTANKGYFFFDNEFVALGSEIKSSSDSDCEVWTTIDQPERKTIVTYFINGKRHIIPLDSNVQLSFTNVTGSAWFHCNNKGYIISPNKKKLNIKLWAENRTGDWHDLDVTYRSGDVQTVNVFQLSINHFAKPKNAKYAYLVLPNIVEEKMNNYFANIPVKILENSESIQAVQYRDSKITEIVFYRPGSITLKSSPGFTSGVGMGDLKSGLIVSVDKPAIVILHKSGNKLDISIADPNQDQEKIVMTVNTKLEGGKNIVWNSTTGNSEITFTFPQGIYLGKSIKSNASFQLMD